MRYLSAVILILQSFSTFPQVLPIVTEHDFPDKSFFQGRRAALIDKLPPSSAAVLFSSPEQKRSGDVSYRYKQDPDFFYLSGLNQTGCALILFKKEQQFGNHRGNAFLITKELSGSEELWTGKKLHPSEADSVLGLTVLKESDSEAMQQLLRETGLIFLKKSGDDPLSLRDKLLKNLSSRDAPYVEKELSGLMASLRKVKQPEEITLLEKAIGITAEAQRSLLKHLAPEMYEYQAQALVEFEFINRGAEAPGFPSIMAGGPNSCILHYEENRRKLESGDLLIADIGAEYHGYSADITRCMPVSGEFTDTQKILYQLVLDAQEAAFKECTPGKEFKDPGKAATEVIAEGLLNLGIIQNKKDFRRYFMHGTSHYLGLDVHDVGDFGLLEAGNVITVEPGIYVPEGSDCDPRWWNTGIRIEDDVLITRDGHRVLSEAVPRSIKDIESMMKH